VPPVPVFPLFLDLPLMTGEEVPHAPHIAITSEPWPGSVAVYSSGSDANYELNRLIAARSTVGVTKTDLAIAAPGRFDRGEGVLVELTSGALESVEDSALLGGANLAAIGDGTPGSWELFQFRDATLVGENTYLLSHRLRGQLGSDAWTPDLWPTGSYFVLINGVPEQINLSEAQRNIARHYRIGPARRSYDDPSYRHEVHAFEAVGLRPLSPVHMKAETESDGDIYVSWVRRSRIGGDSWDGLDVPLGEESEAYLLRVIYNGAILRENEIGSPGWTYTLEDQMTDGISGAFEIQVAQISAMVGAGAFARLDLTL
jgi:hypothetical protein